MKPTKWRYSGVGYVQPEGYRVAVLEAVQPMQCATCDGLIAVGEAFSRRHVRAHPSYPTPLPTCSECTPFSREPEAVAT